MTMTTPHLHNTASPTSGRKPAAGGGWLAAVRRYLAVIAVGNLLWEFAQLPLYTIWYEGSLEEILFAVVHCTCGNVLITTLTLLGHPPIAAAPPWPTARFPAGTPPHSADLTLPAQRRAGSLQPVGAGSPPCAAIWRSSQSVISCGSSPSCRSTPSGTKGAWRRSSLPLSIALAVMSSSPA